MFYAAWHMSLAAEQQALTQLRHLIAGEYWEPALKAAGVMARRISSQERARELWNLFRQIPPQVRDGPAGRLAAAWVAFRAGEEAELQRVLSQTPDAPELRGFRVALVVRQGRYAEAEQLLAQPMVPDQQAIAARYRAQMLAAQGGDWQGAYAEAMRGLSGRDLGVLHTEVAYYCAGYNLTEQARDHLAQAVQALRSAPQEQTLALANLGMACLSAGDFRGAYQALQKASALAQQNSPYRSIVWRMQGDLALLHRWPARARYAYREALRTALTGHDRSMAAENLILTLLLSGEWDEARSELIAAAELPVNAPQDTEHHTVLDLLQAALQLRLGQSEAAERRLLSLQDKDLSQPRRWVLDLLLSEVARQQGQPGPDAPALEQLQWQWPWHQLFPEMYFPEPEKGTAWKPLAPPKAQINLAGPVQLKVGDFEVPLGRKTRGLLAYLVLEGGSTSAESAAGALGLDEGAARTVQKRLSKVVTQLRQQLGSPGTVQSVGGVIKLGADMDWPPPILPPPERAERFCQGDFFPFVNSWIEQQSLSFPED